MSTRKEIEAADEVLRDIFPEDWTSFEREAAIRCALEAVERVRQKQNEELVRHRHDEYQHDWTHPLIREDRAE